MTEDLKRRLGRIKAIVTDVDGCMTDGALIFGEGFVETKAFDVKDGLGVTIANAAGLITAIITGRTSHVVARRARELRFSDCYQGYEGKLAALDAFKNRHELVDEDIAYLGDDLLDLCILMRIGVSFAPADAVKEVRDRVDIVLSATGGHGALREMIERVLKAHGAWNDIIERYS